MRVRRRKPGLKAEHAADQREWSRMHELGDVQRAATGACGEYGSKFGRCHTWIHRRALTPETTADSVAGSRLVTANDQGTVATLPRRRWTSTVGAILGRRDA